MLDYRPFFLDSVFFVDSYRIYYMTIDVNHPFNVRLISLIYRYSPF